MQSGIADPGPGAGVRLTMAGIVGWLRFRLLVSASRGWPAGCPRDRSCGWPSSAATSGIALTPDRAAQARRNLRRVAESLAARRPRHARRPRGRAPTPRALERLVRLAYRHAARYYLEVARTPGVRPADVDATVDGRDAGGRRPGVRVRAGRRSSSASTSAAIELPGLLLANRAGAAVAPMETIDDPRLQAWFVRTRGAVRGAHRRPARGTSRAAGRAARAATSVGLVGDRDLTGGGMPTELFGAPAQLPLGPAILAVESGAPVYVVGARRTRLGRYAVASSPSTCPRTAAAASA